MKADIAIRKTPSTPVVRDLTTSNIGHTSYAELVASVPYAASAIMVSNTSTTPLSLGTGAASAEVPMGLIIPEGTMGIIVPVHLRKAVRLSVIGAPGNAISGYLVIVFLQ